MRAAAESARDSLRRVIEQLEPLDWATPSFEGADRAAFLLAEAYARTGSPARLQALADQVESWPSQTAATQWVVQRGRLAALEHGDRSGESRRVGSATADALSASARLRAGDSAGALELVPDEATASPLGLAIRAQALARLGLDDHASLVALLTADSLTVLGRDLADAARITLATRALAAGEDPSPWLGRTSDAGAYAGRRDHLEGLWRLERGELDAGRASLARAIERAVDHSEARSAWSALGGLALDSGDWNAAYRAYAAADSSWHRQSEAIDWLEALAGADAPWAEWSRSAAGIGFAWLPAEAEDIAWRSRGRAASDLRVAFEPTRSTHVTPAGSSRKPADALPPTEEEWHRLGAARADALHAQHALDRARWALDGERVSLAQLRDYLGVGLGDVRAVRDSLDRRLRQLDALSRTLTEIDERLRALRDAAILRVGLRTAHIRSEVASHRLWIDGMHRLRLAGPDSARMSWAPAGHAPPPTVLEAERSLGDHLSALALQVSEQAPGRIAASYERAWRPGLIDGVLAQRAIAQAALAWAIRIEGSVDSSMAAARSSDRERALRAALAPLERTVHDSQRAWLATQYEVVQSSILRTREAMRSEREGLDYGLAAASYGASVGLDRSHADATNAAPTARDAATVDALDAALETPEAIRWRETGILRMSAFLESHLRSPARAEMRFRLADLRMIEARQRFRESMATYLKQGVDAGRGAPPLLDHASALKLYRSILAEDPEFEHTDATLFNAAMILSDEGADEARTMFERLVADHAGSSYAQESLLRLGDMAFAERAFTACVTLYARSAQGPDPNLRVMALYKLGWAHFNENRFTEAAGAFSAVLDVYLERPEVARQTDLAEESEFYLVHSLAGAGGAAAFSAHFTDSHRRPFELKTLLALGQHLRRYGEFARAAEVDRVAIQRYPESPEALTSAMRLVQTREREDDRAGASAARLEVAPHFTPGSAWAKAQRSDSLRREGEVFAQQAWRSVAQSHHRAARERGAAADWRAARDLYSALLRTWPADSTTGLLHLHLGETESKLGDPIAALAHYRTATQAMDDSVRIQASWQLVAVTDAWYEGTRAGALRGTDALALAVRLQAATHLKGFPSHPKSADLRWRRAQLARAHDWNEEAVADLAELIQYHPSDSRTPDAAVARAEALFALGRFDAAGAAFEEARLVAVAAKRDTLARRAAEATPISWHRHAESLVAADSSAHGRHAEAFARVTRDWPHYDRSHAVLHRAGLSFLAAGRTAEGVSELESLATRFPRSEHAREARLQIAQAWEAAGQKALAADGFLSFAKHHADDASAGDAWLRAADLRAALGDSTSADSLRLAYIQAHPADHETALDVLESLARRELLSVGPEKPVSALLATTTRKGARPGPTSRLGQYLTLATAHPALLSRDLVAQVRFLQGEEAMTAYQAVRLTLPLKRSIAARQTRLDSVLVRYRRAADVGEPRWANAAAYRIGEALADFGAALERSERPADLKGDDRLAYEDVLLGQSHGFQVRAQDVWSDLLRKTARTATDDPWVHQARSSLWRGLGKRFFFQPEVEFPVVESRRTPRASSADTSAPLRASGDR